MSAREVRSLTRQPYECTGKVQGVRRQAERCVGGGEGVVFFP